MSAGPDETTHFLSHVSLFEHVKPDYLPSISQRLEERVFSRDEVIFREGDQGETLYIIKAGSVGVFLIDPNVGLKFELARLRTGQVFGEMALLTKHPRSATCVAMEPTSCLVLESQTFHAIVERLPASRWRWRRCSRSAWNN